MTSDTTSTVELAKRYVEYSCAHDIECIRPLLAENAVYESDNVGRFEGRDDTLAMMTGFFAQYPDITWEVEQYKPISELSVEFNFHMHGANIETGTRIERRGVERIDFTEQGLIARISVNANPAE